MAFPKRLTEKTHRGRVELPGPEPDVADLVPPTREIAHLEELWTLDEESSTLSRLLRWQPASSDDQAVREVFLALVRRVINERPLACLVCGAVSMALRSGGTQA